MKIKRLNKKGESGSLDNKVVGLIILGVGLILILVLYFGGSKLFSQFMDQGIPTGAEFASGCKVAIESASLSKTSFCSQIRKLPDNNPTYATCQWAYDNSVVEFEVENKAMLEKSYCDEKKLNISVQTFCSDEQNVKEKDLGKVKINGKTCLEWGVKPSVEVKEGETCQAFNPDGTEAQASGTWAKKGSCVEGENEFITDPSKDFSEGFICCGA